MTDDQDETEMKLFTRELFDENDDTDDPPEEDDPSDTGPGSRVPREGDNPAPEPDDDLREFARQLFNPA